MIPRSGCCLAAGLSQPAVGRASKAPAAVRHAGRAAAPARLTLGRGRVTRCACAFCARASAWTPADRARSPRTRTAQRAPKALARRVTPRVLNPTGDAGDAAPFA